MRKLIAAIGILFLATYGCGRALEFAPNGMRGSIVARDIQTAVTGTLPSIHVKEDTSDQCGVIFGINASTEIARRTSDGGTRSATVTDLKVGEEVVVWSGPVAESCPAQGIADRVEVLP
jgi:hypothetical protein